MVYKAGFFLEKKLLHAHGEYNQNEDWGDFNDGHKLMNDKLNYLFIHKNIQNIIIQIKHLNYYHSWW